MTPLLVFQTGVLCPRGRLNVPAKLSPMASREICCSKKRKGKKERKIKRMFYSVNVRELPQPDKGHHLSGERFTPKVRNSVRMSDLSPSVPQCPGGSHRCGKAR